MSAGAETKRFAFQGTLVFVENFNLQLDDSITNGAPFEGFYTFDSTTGDSNRDPTVGDY
jgi:hypothetical protein